MKAKTTKAKHSAKKAKHPHKKKKKKESKHTHAKHGKGKKQATKAASKNKIEPKPGDVGVLTKLQTVTTRTASSTLIKPRARHVLHSGQQGAGNRSSARSKAGAPKKHRKRKAHQAMASEQEKPGMAAAPVPLVFSRGPNGAISGRALSDANSLEGHRIMVVPGGQSGLLAGSTPMSSGAVVAPGVAPPPSLPVTAAKSGAASDDDDNNGRHGKSSRKSESRRFLKILAGTIVAVVVLVVVLIFTGVIDLNPSGTSDSVTDDDSNPTTDDPTDDSTSSDTSSSGLSSGAIAGIIIALMVVLFLLWKPGYDGSSVLPDDSLGRTLRKHLTDTPRRVRESLKRYATVSDHPIRDVLRFPRPVPP